MGKSNGSRRTENQFRYTTEEYKSLTGIKTITGRHTMINYVEGDPLTDVSCACGGYVLNGQFNRQTREIHIDFPQGPFNEVQLFRIFRGRLNSIDKCHKEKDPSIHWRTIIVDNTDQLTREQANLLGEFGYVLVAGQYQFDLDLLSPNRETFNTTYRTLFPPRALN